MWQLLLDCIFLSALERMHLNGAPDQNRQHIWKVELDVLRRGLRTDARDANEAHEPVNQSASLPPSIPSSAARRQNTIRNRVTLPSLQMEGCIGWVLSPSTQPNGTGTAKNRAETAAEHKEPEINICTWLGKFIYPPPQLLCRALPGSCLAMFGKLLFRAL